ncbi:hypothetical protein [Gordonia caeni]|uniref:Uncharacterized protein n=1 Tax=Gordonia caeni TaxID=1007097 RepID=A0ABP7PT01_9ACTN
MTTGWVEVLTRMVDGPVAPVTGVVETVDPEPEFRMWFGELPVFVGFPPGAVRVWRDGAKLRVDLPDGTPVFRGDGDRSWSFDPAQPAQSPVSGPARRVHYTGPADMLVGLRDANDWARTDDFTRPTGRPIAEIDFLGRPAWEVELAPPEHKPYPIQLVVDRATGTVLEMRNDGAGVRASYVEFAQADVPHDWYTWDGPVLDVAERDAREGARFDEEQAGRRAWFAENVGAPEFTLPLALTFGEPSVHGARPAADGTLEASLRSTTGNLHARLARRPHSPQPWDPAWDGDVERWSDGDFDWAFTVPGASLDDAARAAVRAAFGPERVAGRRPEASPGDAVGGDG